MPVARVAFRTAAVVAVAAAIVAPLRARRAAVAAVAPQLRTPLLYLPADVTGPWRLRLGRILTAIPTRLAPGVDVRERTVPSTTGGPPIRVLVYDHPARSQSSGVLVWIHGGGLIMGRPEQSHAFCSAAAHDVGALVVSVDYRLAPEHPFPAGLNDCYEVLTWVHDNADDLGVDPARLAVGGDSAGGGLAATLCQLAHDRTGPEVCFQLLVYPMLDDRTVLHPSGNGIVPFVWTAASNRYAWTAYRARPPEELDDRHYLAAARRTDLTGLPPAWIGIGDLDLFLAENLAYAARLQAAGVPVELRRELAMYHGADDLRPTAPAMIAFRRHALSALARALG